MKVTIIGRQMNVWDEMKATIENKLEKLVINGESLIESGAEGVAGTASNPAAMSYALHAMQIENFIGAINGNEKLLIDATEGKKAVKIIEDIYSFDKQEVN